jgi:hypothetical protein
MWRLVWWSILVMPGLMLLWAKAHGLVIIVIAGLWISIGIYSMIPWRGWGISSIGILRKWLETWGLGGGSLGVQEMLFINKLWLLNLSLGTDDRD